MVPVQEALRQRPMVTQRSSAASQVPAVPLSAPPVTLSVEHPASCEADRKRHTEIAREWVFMTSSWRQQHPSRDADCNVSDTP